MNRKVAEVVSVLLMLGMITTSVYGAFLTYKAYVEIYGTIMPLGDVELDIRPLAPIEGLESREDYVGEINVWTYSNDTELILQLSQVSLIVTNFLEFTVKVCQPLDMMFVVDISGSMLQYMNAVKKNLTEIVSLLSVTYKAPLRFGVVGFKDYEDETVMLSLTDDYEAVKEFINGLVAEGGGADPQSHYIGFDRALNEFEAYSAVTNEKVVVFISDAPAGFNNEASFEEAKAKADAMAELGIKVYAVLCGMEQFPEKKELQYYAYVTRGRCIGPEGQNSVFSGVVNHPTWIVKLTPITPFDSFQLRLNSSAPCKKQGYYVFYVYISFYAKAVKRHEFFFVELMANLEKAQKLPPVTNPTSSIDRSKVKVLMVQDDSTHNEWADEWWNYPSNPADHDDTWKISEILSNLGYTVINAEESDLLLMTEDELVEYYKQFDVIWFSNPGWPIDDAKTVSALKTAMESGVGVVMQGDDLLYSEFYAGIDMTPLTGLDPWGTGKVANGVSNDDEKTYNDRQYFRGLPDSGYYNISIGNGHPIQNGLESQTFAYGDDMDLAVVAEGSNVAILLTATPVPSGYLGERPVVTAFIDSYGNREVTILLTLTQPEVAIDISRLCDNVTLWVSRINS